jgi:hypothetical protein
MEHRAAVRDRLAAGPADRLEHVGHGLGEHDVAGGHAQRPPERRDAGRRLVDGDDGCRRADAPAAGVRDDGLATLQPAHARALVDAHAALEQAPAQAEGEPRGLHRRGAAQHRPAAEERRAAARGDLRWRQRHELVGGPKAARTRDGLRPGVVLRGRGGHEQVRRARVPGVDVLRLAPRADRVHRRVGGAGERERRGVAGTGGHGPGLVPPAVDEAAVAPRGAEAAAVGLEHDDARARGPLEDVPRTPKAQVAAADHHDVGLDGLVERRQDGRGAGLADPVAVGVVPHGPAPTGPRAGRPRPARACP